MPGQKASFKNKDSSFSLPLKIGITGGIGAGKSLVCKIFTSLGIPVYDADNRAKQLMITDPILIRQIKSSFGEKAYTSEGSLDRSFLAGQVFGDTEKLGLLNSLVHPMVGLDFEKWVRDQKQAPYVLKEAALIFESGSDKKLDTVIVVGAPEELRIRRTVIRDTHRSRKQVEEIIQKQLPEEERLSKAGYKILNDEKRLLIPQVLKLHKIFSEGKV